MTLKRRDKIPDCNHIIRYISPNKFIRDENLEVIGISWEAFKIKEPEEGLSVSWLEYFSGNRSAQESAAIKGLRNSKLVVQKKSGFAIGKIHDIVQKCNYSKSTKETHVIYLPSTDNAAHSEVKNMPYNNSVLEYLAAEIWNNIIMNIDIP